MSTTSLKNDALGNLIEMEKKSHSDFLECLKACVTQAERTEVLSFLLTQQLDEAEFGLLEMEAEEAVRTIKERVLLLQEINDFKAKIFLWQLKRRSGN